MTFPVSHSHRHASPSGNACYVLSVARGRRCSPQAQLTEILGLVEAQGDRVVGHRRHGVVDPDPRIFIGQGLANEVREAARRCRATMVVVDADLTPSQTRNLERELGMPICDREAVILNVFARHASSGQARIQVELAHLQYLRPRIRGMGLNMDQQAGGLLGNRGAGETASELLARRMDGRIAELRRRLARIETSGRSQRKRRSDCARMVLVGYTNAGKTSLMNALASTELSVRDRPFETTDTTSRCLSRYGGDVLLSDTVGFIRDLPQRLYASFSSTLAEVREATLVVVVLDASDPEHERHMETTAEVLAKLGAGHVPRFVVFNKADRASLGLRSMQRIAAGARFASACAHDPSSTEALRQRLLSTARAPHKRREVFVPYDQPEAVRTIYARCRVHQTKAVETGLQFVVEAAPHIVDNLARTVRLKRAG